MSSYRDTVLRLGRTRLGTAVRDALGVERVRAASRVVLRRRARGAGLRATTPVLRARFARPGDPSVHRTRSGLVTDVSDWQPRWLRDDNLARTVAALETAGVTHALLRTTSASRHTVAVAERDRDRVLDALAAAPGLATAEVQRVAASRSDEDDPVTGRPVPVPAATVAAWSGWTVLRVFRRVRAGAGSFVVGERYGCDVELWREGTARGVGETVEVGPRPNVVSDVLPLGTLADTEPFRVGVRTYPRPRLMGTTVAEDVTFEVDAVYTWVDGSDPAWRERMLSTRARLRGDEHHPEAASPNRFASRDELRHSLRSLASYAPWVRHVWLVTDRQRPAWLADDTPGLTVVDHRDLVDDPAVLPLFNSNAIVSRLHHISGLAEHYLYLNDDMFFGHDVAAADFFHPSGSARLFPARLHRPFGRPTPGDAPFVNTTRTMRALLQARFGVAITHAVRHTPYPQLRSVQAELEALFPEAYATVLRHPFRHHEEIAPEQLLHHYLQVAGNGVPSALTYDYVNVGVAEEKHRLRRLLLERDRAVFCLNDDPRAGTDPVSDEEVAAFLTAYFPVPSAWER